MIEVLQGSNLTVDEIAEDFLKLDASNDPITGELQFRGVDAVLDNGTAKWDCSNSCYAFDNGGGSNNYCAGSIGLNTAGWWDDGAGDLHWIASAGTDITGSNYPPDGVTDVDCLLLYIDSGAWTDYFTIFLLNGEKAGFTAFLNTQGFSSWNYDAEETSIFTANGANTSYTYAGNPSGWTIVGGYTDPPTLTASFTDTIKLDASAGNVLLSGDIGTLTDTDLISLATDIVTINGDLEVEGTNIGISTDKDLMAMANNALTINGDIAPTDVNLAAGTGYIRFNGDGGNCNLRYDNADSIDVTVEGVGIAQFVSSGAADSGILCPKHAAFGSGSGLSATTVFNINESIEKDFGTDFVTYYGLAISNRWTPSAAADQLNSYGYQCAADVFMTNSATDCTINRTDISFTNPSTISTAAGDFTAAGFEANQWIYVSGSDDNDYHWQINTINATTITITGSPNVTTEAAGDDVTITGSHRATAGDTNFYDWGGTCTGSEYYAVGHIPNGLSYPNAGVLGLLVYARGGQAEANGGYMGNVKGASYSIETNYADVGTVTGQEIYTSLIQGSKVDSYHGLILTTNIESTTEIFGTLRLVNCQGPNMADSASVTTMTMFDLGAPSLGGTSAITGDLTGLYIADMSGIADGNNYGIHVLSDCLMSLDRWWYFGDTDVKVGSDDDGHLDLHANDSIDVHGYLELHTIRSGATQAAAGATANEVWKTASHATLPDNVLMIGV